MMHRTSIIILFVLLGCAACFGPSSFMGLTPGQSTRADAERALGQPVKKMIQIECTSGIEAIGTAGHFNCAHSISAHNIIGLIVGNDQVLAGRVEFIAVAAGLKRGIEPFAELEIEHFKAEFRRRFDLLNTLSKADDIFAVCKLNLSAAMKVAPTLSQLGH